MTNDADTTPRLNGIARAAEQFRGEEDGHGAACNLQTAGRDARRYLASQFFPLETPGLPGISPDRMKTLRTPAIVMGTVYLLFFVCLVWSSGQLPEQVATHFDGRGQPDGWMNRSSHLLFTTVLGFALPLSILGICFAMRFAPASLINIPHREHWLAAERRSQTFAFIFRHAFWLASMSIAFVIGVNLLIIQSNNQSPPSLSIPLLFGFLGCYLAGLAIWTFRAIRYFKRPVCVGSW
jgi:hypothetical protein